MNILIVVSHPDDEVLGMGGTGHILVQSGHLVTACILSGDVKARTKRPEDKHLYDDIIIAQKIVGFQDPVLGDFPNIKFNNVTHLDLVQFIEDTIVKTNSDIIFTHHPSDLNNDHRHTSLACQAAARLPQRRDDLQKLRALYFMEIPSATDWSFPGQEIFTPDTFCEIGEIGLKKKITAISSYRHIMRDFPHPRSEKILTSMAAYRGGQSGLNYAEAFQTAFSVMDFR